MKQVRRVCCGSLLVVVLALAQETKQPAPPKSTAKDIDPLALQVLKAALDPIRAANSYSFQALVSTEQLGTNGQVVTLFNISDVTLEKPDKLRVNFKGRGKEVELYHRAGSAVLYTPSAKVYSSVAGAATIDAGLDNLEKRDVYLPIRNFLASDPYKSLTDGLQTAYVVGRVRLLDNETAHQLVFTEPDAEWQLWVTGGENPRVVRLQVVDKSKTYLPRTTVQFLDWNLNANPTDQTFTFNKPADAKEIPFARRTARKNQ